MSLGFLAIPTIFAAVTFAWAMLSRRAYVRKAMVVGSIPAVVVASINLAALANPLTWLLLFAIWLPCVVGALAGAGLAQLIVSARQRA